ncbi:ImmA/IrrE family metallo-endopeptidase [Petroclostridium sp. X23]|uniref:ImmA/IrrE family metallo-endopeptidase n=1 Tax=Petroclostridium sp. X23 TaxID=3045146 RepID=UPI0024AC83BA|nr:ImmA/IrrE family metallo-endopeptidase [Petroclostridium sp. X23]WHH58443.1 ImmA/IrrE family metallo-endopeptidase [Petroclostridium sp. X23]
MGALNIYIKDKAQKLIKKFKTYDPIELATAMNIEIKYYKFQEMKGFYLYYQRKRCIGINSNLSDIEQRLCCAHEIGHDQLHRRFVQYMKDYHMFSDVRHEYEANILAAHLLIPDSILVKYQITNYSIAEIAAQENLYPELLKLKLQLEYTR